MLLLRERNLVEQLFLVDRLNLHEDAESFVSAFILANGKGLASLRRSLMDDVELRRWMLSEKVPEDELSLRFAVRLNFAFDRDVYRLKQIFRQFLRTASFDGFPNLINDIALSADGKHL